MQWHAVELDYKIHKHMAKLTGHHTFKKIIMLDHQKKQISNILMEWITYKSAHQSQPDIFLDIAEYLTLQTDFFKQYIKTL